MRISPASLRWPLVALLSGLAVWEASRAPQAALAALLLGSLLGLGLSFLTAFAYLHVAGQRRLGEAERLWHAGQPASAVSEHLAPVVRAPGELGYRILLLRAKAHAALEWRNQAWQDLQQAQLRRLPWRLRRRVARFLEGLPTEPSEQDLRQGEALLRACPNVPRIHHGLGLLHLRRGEGEAAWDCFGKALPLATEDFLLLEDVLRAAQDQPARRALAEEALRGLLQFHGDPRVPWDRASGARFLVNQGRFPETVALLAPLPPRQRTQPWHWAGLAIALRGLGDPEGAWREVESGLEHHPQNFRLWMERFQLALDDSKDAEAESSLEEARRVLPPGPEGQAMQWEWLLRKAEFEYWARGDAQAAYEALEQVPPERQGPHHPPLRLQVLVALGDYEAAHRHLGPLLQRSPEDPELLLMQADILAGLEAWKALLPFLDQMPAPPRSRALFWHLRGLALIHLDDPNQSRVDLERAAHMEPTNLRFVLDAGHACAELGDWNRSETHWRQALNLDGTNEEALVQLSEARLALHDALGARQLLRECLTHHPESQEAQTRLAELEAQ